MTGTKKSQKDESQEQSVWYVACIVGNSGVGNWWNVATRAHPPSLLCPGPMGDLWPHPI